ncbi:hypothetical protein D3C71_1133930 [compost metagenome]
MRAIEPISTLPSFKTVPLMVFALSSVPVLLTTPTVSASGALRICEPEMVPALLTVVVPKRVC